MKRKGMQEILNATKPEDIFTMDLEIIEKEKEEYLSKYKPKEYKVVENACITKKIVMLYRKAILILEGNETSPENYANPPIQNEYNITERKGYDGYSNPPIPKDYKHTEGEWYNGFVIQRISDGSEFVWVPVEFLDANGTIDGETFDQKFGRRNYRKNKFSKNEFHERMSKELRNQRESVAKYGGFYISRYNVSQNEKGKPQSKKHKKPWENINVNDAKEVASQFENTDDVKSHLTYGCEYDSVLEWFIKSKARTLADIAKDSTNWGNYWVTKKSPHEVAETGFREEWCTNNIYDFAGNVFEWTQEQYGEQYGRVYSVSRGGRYNNCNDCPVAYRNCHYPNDSRNNTGFRIALLIK